MIPSLPDFRLETHFSKWEFKARYHMTASDAESMALRDLLASTTPNDRFRLGFGCCGLDEGLAALEAYLMQNKAD